MNSLIWMTVPEFPELDEDEIREGLLSLVEDGDLVHRIGPDGYDEYAITPQGETRPHIQFGEWELG